MLVPQTIGELVDRLGWMVLTAPEFKSSMRPDGNIDIAFSTLKQAIENICIKLGQPPCAELHQMADESRVHLEGGRLKDGVFRLQDMVDYLTQRRWKDSL